jgi:hypothetical protein
VSEKPFSAQPPDASATRGAPRRGRSVLRTSFRVFRITLLLVVFVVVVTGFFLNKIGLPEFAKQRFVRELQAKGWEADFSRLRLRWHRGIVADDLHLRRTNGYAGPNLFVSHAEYGLNFRAFTQLKLDVNSFKMTEARLVWPIQGRNEYQPSFSLNNIAGELYFRPNDLWELSFLQGELLGARVHFSGVVTNGSLIRDWRIGEKRRARARDPVALWEEIVRTVAQLRFAAKPQLTGVFRGDAADLPSFDATLTFKVPGVMSPWGVGTNVLMTARLFPGSTGESVQADFVLTAAEVTTEFLAASELRMNVEIEPRYTNAWPTNVNVAIELKNVHTDWGDGDYALLTSRLTASPTNSSLLQTDLKALVKGFKRDKHTIATSDIKLLVTHPPTTWLAGHLVATGELRQVKSELGDATAVSIKFDGNLPDATNWFLPNTNFAWPERIRSLPFRSQVTVADANKKGARADKLALDVDWHWPALRLNADGALYRGRLKGDTQLNVETREATFKGRSTFDVKQIAPLLGTNAQKFLKNYSWENPPTLEAEGRVVLPSLTNNVFDLTPEALATLSLGGSFEVGPAAYKGIAFSSAKAPFAFTNDIWRIDALELKRPEGEFHGAYISKPATKEFHWKLRSAVDPRAFKTLFVKEIEQQVFDFFEFSTPPLIEGEVWGHWRDPERVGIRAEVRGENFKFRGESIGLCTASLRYTNLFLAILNPEIQRPNEKGVAPGIGIDFKHMRIWLTNAFGNLDPHAVARCIGPKTAEVLEDYKFDRPPTTRVNGSVDLKRGSDEDDLHFEIQGGVFHWQDFHFHELAGRIDWIGRTMVLTNMHGLFHDGRVEGHAHFAFPRKKGADFTFKLTAVEVDFHSFMSDLIGKTNRLEGVLNGELTVVAGNTAQPNSWMGHGNVYLREGLIWDIPVFGLFSPILNAIVPGVGNSRAKQGIAQFLITNSVISTTDLDIQATGMRMHFSGTVDFERRIDSRVEAELLRDLPGIGIVLSKILWPVTKLFEYRVTGTLADPKAQPVYIVPKILLLPFMPFKVLKDLVTEDPKPIPPKAPE